MLRYLVPSFARSEALPCWGEVPCLDGVLAVEQELKEAAGMSEERLQQSVPERLVGHRQPVQVLDPASEVDDLLELVADDSCIPNNVGRVGGHDVQY